MVVCIVGEIIQLSPIAIVVREVETEEEITCSPEGTSILDLQVGDKGVFVGRMINGHIAIKHMDVRKFLDPLYEADLYKASGKYTMVDVIENPFTMAYTEMMEKQRKEDELT